MSDKPMPAAGIAVLILIVLLGVYLVSYLSLVRPMAVLVPQRGTPGSYDLRHYRYGGVLAETLFWPLEQVDRSLRPNAWREPIFH